MTPNDQRAEEPQPASKIEQRAGDRATQIGQIFGGVVFQLLSTKAALAIVVVLLIVVAGVAYLYSEAQKPTRMTGDFNIAIAQFGEVTDQGIVPSAWAIQISKLLFDFLDSEYKATDFGLNIQVAREKIGVVTEAREAEQLAYDINADVVIYGSIFVVGSEAILSPRFYIRDQPETAELTGQHQLRFDISSLDSIDRVTAELRSRAAVLLSFTTGLTYLSAKQPDEALRAFQAAIRVADNYGRFDGQEVLYLFAAVASSRPGNYEKAGQYLDQALSLNPEYARAFIARGNIYYNQAIPTWDANLLNQALIEYENALKAKVQPAGAYVIEKVNVSLGNIYVIRAQQTGDPGLFAKAIDLYNQVTTRYEQTKNERIKNFASVAYFGLGAAYERQRDYTRAEAAYRQCIELTDDPQLRSRAETQLSIVRGQQ